MDCCVPVITMNEQVSDLLFAGDVSGSVSMIDMEKQEITCSFNPIQINPFYYASNGVTKDPVVFGLLDHTDLLPCNSPRVLFDCCRYEIRSNSFL